VVYPWGFVLAAALCIVATGLSVRRGQPYLAGCTAAMTLVQLSRLVSRSGHGSSALDLVSMLLLLVMMTLFVMSIRSRELSGRT
jgi:hypothetical protein